MKRKLKLPKVSDFVYISRFVKWNRRMGDIFEKGDVLYTVESLGKEYEIRAEEGGILTEMGAFEFQMLEVGDVVGAYESTPEIIEVKGKQKLSILGLLFGRRKK